MSILPLAWVEPRALTRALLGCSSLILALVATVQALAPSSSKVEVLAAHTPVVDEAALLAVAEPATAAPAADGRPRLIKAGFMPEFASSAATLRAVDPFRAPRSARATTASSRDLECLTQAVYFESRGDTLAGQAAVAQVVLNRSHHPAFPSSICAVIYQGQGTRVCQFSWVCRPTPMNRNSVGYREARQVAEAALQGRTDDQVGTATFFHAARINPGWRNLTRVKTVGAHVFYRFSDRRGVAAAFTRAPTPSRARGRNLGEALMAAVSEPLNGVLQAPAVTTVTAPPPPVIALPPAQVAVAPAPAPAAEPAASMTDAVATGTPSEPAATLAPAELTVS